MVSEGVPMFVFCGDASRHIVARWSRVYLSSAADMLVPVCRRKVHVSEVRLKTQLSPHGGGLKLTLDHKSTR